MSRAAGETRDRALLERLLRREPEWAAYGLGDLEPPLWERTRWFVTADQEALALVFSDVASACLITFGAAAGAAALLPSLPLPDADGEGGFSAHLPATHTEALRPLLVGDLVPFQRMALRAADLRLLEAPRVEGALARTARLGPDDVAAAQAFYAAHYPENWFDPARLDAGCYLGVWLGDALVGVGGTHVLAPAQRVAALGDIVTDPTRRGLGLGAYLTHALCAALLPQVDLLVLNVASANAPARRAYAKVGFRDAVDHVEGWPLRRSACARDEA